MNSPNKLIQQRYKLSVASEMQSFPQLIYIVLRFKLNICCLFFTVKMNFASSIKYFLFFER